MRRLPRGRPRIALLRVLLFRGSLLLQTEHPHPMAGTPTLVPVPKRIISPGNSMLWRVKVTAVGDGSRERVAAATAATMRRKRNCEGYPPSLASSQLLCFRNSIAVFGTTSRLIGNQRLLLAPHICMAFPLGGTIIFGNSRPSGCGAVGPGSLASFAHGLAPRLPLVRKHLPAHTLRLPLTLSCNQLETLFTLIALPSFPLGRDRLPARMHAAE